MYFISEHSGGFPRGERPVLYNPCHTACHQHPPHAEQLQRQDNQYRNAHQTSGCSLSVTKRCQFIYSGHWSIMQKQLWHSSAVNFKGQYSHFIFVWLNNVISWCFLTNNVGFYIYITHTHEFWPYLKSSR